MEAPPPGEKAKIAINVVYRRRPRDRPGSATSAEQLRKPFALAGGSLARYTPGA